MAEIAQTADHALRILEELGQGRPLTASELARVLGLNRTVVHRLLTTLRARGFVLSDEDGYRPGPTLIRVAGATEPGLRGAAKRIMDKVAAETGETVTIHVPDDLEAVVLTQSIGFAHTVQVISHVGARYPITRAATGRAILAFLPESTVRSAQAKYPVAGLDRKLEAIRQMRYAISYNELGRDSHALSVPLFRGDRVLGSLSIIVPVSRGHVLESHVEVLLREGREVSRAAASLEPRIARTDAARDVVLPGEVDTTNRPAS